MGARGADEKVGEKVGETEPGPVAGTSGAGPWLGGAAPWGVGGAGAVRGGMTKTFEAVTVSLATEPTAPAKPPTHTSANDDAGDAGSMNAVVDVTSTVKTVFFPAVTVKVPESSAVPQVAAVSRPFTDVTTPKAP